MTATTPAAPPPGAQPQGVEPPSVAALAAARRQLAHERARARRGLCIEAVALLLFLLLAFALPSFATDRLLRLELPFRIALLLSFAWVVGRTVRRRLLVPLQQELSDEELALAVERQSPDLAQALISSLQFEQDLARASDRRESRELKSAVVTGVRDRLGAIPFARAIDAGRVRRHALLAVGCVLAFGLWGAIDASTLGLWARRNLLLSDVDWPRYTTLVLPDGAARVRLPQGDALTVVAAVDGHVPDEAFVDYRFATGERGREPMSRTGERQFGWTLDPVLAAAQLTLRAGDALPVTIDVEVVPRPRIENLSLRVRYPAYMERADEDLPATESELRLPHGAELTIAGSSQKPLTAAFVLHGDGQQHALACGEDGRSFGGTFRPEASGAVTIDVLDVDRLGAAAPPRLLLRVGEDKAPVVEFRLRGIGSSITAHARIPGQLVLRDDFGLRSVQAVMRAVVDAAGDGAAATAAADVPFGPAEVLLAAPLPRGARRHETEASVDLARLNRSADENAKDNTIRPGMLVSLRYSATDNFGPGEPHEGAGETMSFRVVTRDRLVEDLRRRQLEQRQELLRIVQEQDAALLELGELVNPAAAGDRREAAEERLRVVARRQQALGRRVGFVGDVYQRILWEYENNRLIEANKVRQLEAVIPAPLAMLAAGAFPESGRTVDRFVRTTDEVDRQAGVAQMQDILRQLRAVLAQMQQAENLAALLEDLRTIIRLEDEAIRAVQGRVQDREQNLFRPKKN
jgi:hypothetical protein